MAVLAIFTGPITKSQYDTVRKDIDWVTNQPHGAIFHAASFDEAGHAHVADVWESPEALNAFVQQRLMPAMQRHKVPQPAVSVFPTHVIHAFKAIEKHRI